MQRILPPCSKHRHLKPADALRMTKKQELAWIGPKQVISSLGTITCLEANGSVSSISDLEADLLCTTGHAKWKRVGVIEVIKNLHGAALSLKVGSELAFWAATKRGSWARCAIADIMG